MRRRFKEHSAKLFVIKDTPHSIALGAAIGILLGFTPLFGLKTLLALLLAALFRVNKLAAVVAVTLYDVVFPLWPVLYRVEFDLGYWLLHEPHQWPAHLDLHGFDYHEWLDWNLFSTVGGPTLLGSLILGVPASLLMSFFLKRVLVRKQQRPAKADAQIPCSLGKGAGSLAPSITASPSHRTASANGTEVRAGCDRGFLHSINGHCSSEKARGRARR